MIDNDLESKGPSYQNPNLLVMDTPKHWAEDLVIADRCRATIRHATDGTKNRHDVELIVAENMPKLKSIEGYDATTDRLIVVDYCELKRW